MRLAAVWRNGGASETPCFSAMNNVFYCSLCSFCVQPKMFIYFLFNESIYNKVKEDIVSVRRPRCRNSFPLFLLFPRHRGFVDGRCDGRRRCTIQHSKIIKFDCYSTVQYFFVGQKFQAGSSDFHRLSVRRCLIFLRAVWHIGAASVRQSVLLYTGKIFPDLWNLSPMLLMAM